MNFSFQTQYIGIWRIPNMPNVTLSGTLFMKEQSIGIDLYFQNTVQNLPEELERLTGTTYTINEQNSKEELLNIELQHLTFIRYTNFNGGLKHYKYEVKELYIYEGCFEKDNIKEINIRASILDKWAAPILSSAFNSVHYDNMPDYQHIIKFIQRSPYSLQDSDNTHTYLYFSYSRYYGGIYQGIKQKTLFCIKPNTQQTFDESLTLIKQYSWLLYLIMNRVFFIDYLIFHTPNGKFIYKISNKYAYRYVEIHPNAEPHTTLDEFTQDEISSIFSKWDSFYTKYYDAVDTFYESLSNLYLPPSSLMKNYISIIDAFTRSIKGETGEINNNTERAKTVYEILEKTKDVLTSDEKNKLKMWLLYNKGTGIKPRFCKLLEQIKDLLPRNINNEFVEKIINTRNNITHPNNNEDYSFREDQYEDVSYLLTKIIRAYILKHLGISEIIIKRLVTF